MRLTPGLAFAVVVPVLALARTDVTSRGPFTVGTTTITWTRTSSTTGAPRPLATVIWYPAKPGTGTALGEDEFRDAAVLPRHWPIVLFSHGSCGIPEQSIFLTATLASRGFVVVAPPHPGNEFTEFPACMAQAELVDSYLNRLDDMRFALDQILSENDRAGSPFRRRLDARRIGMSGHSFGALDALRVAAFEPRVRAALSLAPARPAATGGRIRIPTMIEGAERDSLAPFETDARDSYALLDGPRFLVEILNTGHFAFSDVCAGAIFGTPDCAPGTLSQDDAHRLALRYAIPFLERYVGRRTRRLDRLLKPPAVPGVVYQAEPRR
jgi:predicted dienelactone hydrolase